MKRRRKYSREHVEENFWPSFTDMIATIILILFLLVFIFLIKDIVNASNREDMLARINALKAEEKQISEKLSQEKAKIEQIKQELETREAESENLKEAFVLSLKQLEENRQIIADSNEELGNLRTKLQSVALIRVNVLNQVKEAIEKELGSGEDAVMSVAENGNLVLNESILFDTGSYKLKQSSKDILNKLAVSFEKVLDDESTRKYIDAIEIQGHADARKGGMSNSVLSSNRATSVVDYLMSVNPVLEQKYGGFFAASGYSSFRPRVSGENEEAWASNRRIEISVKLKDPAIKNLINEYLSDSVKVVD